MAITYRLIKGSKLTNLEGDDNFRWNAESITSASNTVLMNKLSGYLHGTFATPITGTINIDLTGAQNDAKATIIWSGSSNPTISGATINEVSGNITAAGTYTIKLNYINSRLNVEIFNGQENGLIVLDGYIVTKGTGNTNRLAVQVGDIIDGQFSSTRYIRAQVDALPYTTEANLTFFIDNTII